MLLAVRLLCIFCVIIVIVSIHDTHFTAYQTLFCVYNIICSITIVVQFMKTMLCLDMAAHDIFIPRNGVKNLDSACLNDNVHVSSWLEPHGQQLLGATCMASSIIHIHDS